MFNVSFDKYIDKELPNLKTFLSEKSLHWVERLNDTEYQRIISSKWRFILRGIYSFHFRQWLKYYSSERILVIDGDKLTTQPWEVMLTVQKFANLSVSLERKNFVLNRKTGFYCLKSFKHKSRFMCMEKTKGKTRSFRKDSKIVQSKMSEDIEQTLREFYRSYDYKLKQLLSTDFKWMKVSK